jgi:hypothetical protein
MWLKGVVGLSLRECILDSLKTSNGEGVGVAAQTHPTASETRPSWEA